jgi:16S rRNA (guanine966-N2)-methyltransferase
VAELRIVAGEWRGRRIAVPDGPVRPTADRVREAWMSIVLPAIDGARVVDLCAGSGALGLEALSRGAEHADFVERDGKVFQALRDNVKTLNAGDRATLHRAEAGAFLAEHADSVTALRGPASSEGERGAASGAPSQKRWDVAFADPPYRQGVAVALAERWLAAPFATIFGVEHEAELTLPEPTDGSGATADRRVYGDTALTIYRTI